MAETNAKPYREKAIEEYGDRCQICESIRDIRVHHIDGDRSNNGLDNLLVVCSVCHAEIHSPGQSGMPYDKYRNHLPEESIYGVTGNGDTVIPRSVSIRKDQKEWLEDTPINFSAFVRKKLDELRQEFGGV